MLTFSFYLVEAQLTYSVVTSGLNSISFDGGGTELECGDVDGDGDIDIVSVGTHGAPNVNATEAGVMVWKNNGTGTNWSAGKSGNFGYGGCALGDVNNDGKMDIGYAMHHNWGANDFGDQLIEVALGDGTGSSWTPYDDGLATNGETYGMFGIDFADINNDGLLDLASNSFGCCAGVHAYKNNGDGTWTQIWGIVGGNSMSMAELGDYDRDGYPDMFMSSEIGNVYKNSAGTGFASMQPGIPLDWTMRFSLGDVNNDGAVDMAAYSSMIGTVSDLKVYTFNLNTNTWVSISNGLPNPATGVNRIKLAHMDKDGNMDLLTWSPDSVRIYKGDGAGNWTRNGGFGKPETQMVGWGVADFNHDGYGDVAVIGSSGNTNLKVYMSVQPTPNSLTIIPLTPKGYECFMPGSAQFLKWISAVPVGPAAQVTIEYSSTGSAGPWATVVNNYPNSGTYQWAVPNINSNNCFLKYTVTAGTTPATVITSNAFGIGTCTPPTSVNDAANSNSHLTVFPNPFNEVTTISIEGWNKSQDWQLAVYDVMGSLVYGQPVDAAIITLRPNLTSGVYFVEVKGGENKMKEKIVLVK